jgi:integrase
VFASPRTGGRLDNVKRGFEAVLARAKIENFRFHDLRHTFASRLVMAGVDINTVRELMTHSDIKMTLVYAHLSPDHKAAALERAFGGGS